MFLCVFRVNFISPKYSLQLSIVDFYSALKTRRRGEWGAGSGDGRRDDRYRSIAANQVGFIERKSRIHRDVVTHIRTSRHPIIRVLLLLLQMHQIPSQIIIIIFDPLHADTNFHNLTLSFSTLIISNIIIFSRAAFNNLDFFTEHFFFTEIF